MSGPPPDDSSTGRGPRADAIVVAAGRSTRMDGIDKVLAPVAGRPLLAWTLDGLAAAPAIERIVLVTAPERVAELQAMPWLPANVVAVVAGGDVRQVSVAAGFDALEGLDGDGRDAAGERVLLVQDGARPVVDRGMVERVIAATYEHGAALPVVPIAETVKRLDGESVGETVDREGLGLAQTPQGVRRALLREAYARFPPAGEPTFTDEAALLEACRIAVHVVPGDPSNLKVTRPSDLRRVEVALAEPATAAAPLARATRVGIGQDQHPFGPGSPLALGGIVVDGAPALHGHSDGDVALHAVCDALLGAAGLGDLGRLFPADATTPEGIASGLMLDGVVRRVGAAGWRVSNLDLTIVAARPRLGAHLDGIRDAIAGRLGVAPDAVNVKASTGNLMGDDGAGRSISAIAIVLLESAS